MNSTRRADLLEQAIEHLDTLYEVGDDCILSDALGVELGVYGAPESFLLDAEGTIVYKRVGDINPRIWRDELLPHLRTLEVAVGALAADAG